MGRLKLHRHVAVSASVALIAALACGDDQPAATGDSGTSTSTGSTGVTATAGSSSSSGGSELEPFAACYADAFVNPFPGTNYDPLGITVGSHCLGTNHQTIEGVERVVFLGDSVTVGTPPTPVDAYYRNRLADALADRFDLAFDTNKATWQTPSITTGQSGELHSGDFSSCAEFGGRNDDLLSGVQLDQCFAEDTRGLRTLTIITSGGNDAASIARDAGEGVTGEALRNEAEAAVEEKRRTIEWLVDPTNFPNGNFVVFANVYEFTDATAEVEACPGAALGGFMPLPNPAEVLVIVATMEAEYAKIAVDTGTDFIFMFEEFCGHGFNSSNPSAPCYRGSGAANWFDGTCLHPTATGHDMLAQMFLAVIEE